MAFEKNIWNARPQYQFYQYLNVFQYSDMFRFPDMPIFIKLYVRNSVVYLKVQLILQYFHSKGFLQQ